MKIFIFGGPGSGKTTIANKLSKEFNLPYFELDKLLYNENDEEKRSNIVEKFIHEPDWITEGVYRQNWLDKILVKADIVFLLIVPKNTRIFNTTKRTIKRILGFEKSFHESNLKTINEFIKFNNEFERHRYIEFENRLNKLNIKPVIVKNYSDIKESIDKLQLKDKK